MLLCLTFVGYRGGSPIDAAVLQHSQLFSVKKLFKKIISSKEIRTGIKEIEQIFKNYENSACAAIVAALRGYNKQTLKSQMRDRL